MKMDIMDPCSLNKEGNKHHDNAAYDMFERIFCFSKTRQNQPSINIRVSQKKQKSKFCFATKPAGFHRLDEPPEKISAL